MAKIVLGIGTSHTPLLTLGGERWAERAADDLKNTALNLSDGRWVAYDELAKEVDNRYADVCTTEHFLQKSKTCQEALDRLAKELRAAEPDVVVVIGDDQDELFSLSNMPCVSIFYGEEIITHPRDIKESSPSWLPTVAEGYAQDDAHVFRGAPEFALDLIRDLIGRHVDMGAAAKVDDSRIAGFGHAYGFVVKRLFGGRQIPMVPILLNTYFPPNVLSPARCHQIGQLLRTAIESNPKDLRVAVVASGGLSHFVVDEKLDKTVTDALAAGDSAALRSLPPGALNAGSSEILNWVMAAGALEGLKNRWIEYQPLYRTPAGTGIGAAFALWS